MQSLVGCHNRICGFSSASHILSALKGLDEGRLRRAAFDADVARGLGWYDGLASKLRAHAVHLPRRV